LAGKNRRQGQKIHETARFAREMWIPDRRPAAAPKKSNDKDEIWTKAGADRRV